MGREVRRGGRVDSQASCRVMGPHEAGRWNRGRFLDQAVTCESPSGQTSHSVVTSVTGPAGPSARSLLPSTSSASSRLLVSSKTISTLSPVQKARKVLDTLSQSPRRKSSITSNDIGSSDASECAAPPRCLLTPPLPGVPNTGASVQLNSHTRLIDAKRMDRHLGDLCSKW